MIKADELLQKQLVKYKSYVARMAKQYHWDDTIVKPLLKRSRAPRNSPKPVNSNQKRHFTTAVILRT